MAGLVPAIHALAAAPKAWMRGSSSAHDGDNGECSPVGREDRAQSGYVAAVARGGGAVRTRRPV